MDAVGHQRGLPPQTKGDKENGRPTGYGKEKKMETSEYRKG